jgi:hypothetical protein
MRSFQWCNWRKISSETFPVRLDWSIVKFNDHSYLSMFILYRFHRESLRRDYWSIAHVWSIYYLILRLYFFRCHLSTCRAQQWNLSNYCLRKLFNSSTCIYLCLSIEIQMPLLFVRVYRVTWLFSIYVMYSIERKINDTKIFNKVLREIYQPGYSSTHSSSYTQQTSFNYREHRWWTSMLLFRFFRLTWVSSLTIIPNVQRK